MTDNKKHSIALMRYSAVNFVLTWPGSQASYGEVCRLASSRQWTEEDGTPHKVSHHTIDRWVRAYKKNGFEGLCPCDRSDLNVPRKLNPDIKKAVVDMLVKSPKAPATVILEQLADQGIIQKNEFSYSTLSRFVKSARKDMDINQLIGDKELRRYEKQWANMVWYGDSTHSVYVPDESGKRSKVYIIALIDDASRMITGCQAYFQDNAESLILTIQEAVLRHGVPELFSFDNGSNYRSSQVKYLAARIQTMINFAPPYTPTSKGKVERFFRTLQMRWESTLTEEDTKDLASLRKSLRRYIDSYNMTPHSSLKSEHFPEGKSPSQRFFEDSSRFRYLPDSQTESLFLFEDQRKVSADGVLKLNGTEYETDYRFARQKVTIRFDSQYRKVYIQEKGNLIEIRPLDKIENGNLMRRQFRMSQEEK